MFHAYNYLILKLETDKQLLECFKWLGNVFAYIAAFAICISLTFAEAIWPFVLYTIASLVWMKVAQIVKDRPLFWLQIFFVCLNCYAIWLRA